MGYALLSFLVAFAALVVKTRVERSDDSRRLCNGCGYDLAGLAAHAHCPECGGRERMPVRPDRTIVVFVRWRAAMMGAAILAWTAIWFVHVNVAHAVILERMIRAGFDPYAAGLWVSRNGADAVVFDSAGGKRLHSAALVCAALSPWATVLPRRWAWIAVSVTLVLGVSAVAIAYFTV